MQDLWLGLMAVVILLAGLTFMFGAGLSPAALIGKLFARTTLGLLLLLFTNALGSPVSFTVPVNPASVLITGILGLPGLGVVACLTYLL